MMDAVFTQGSISKSLTLDLSARTGGFDSVTAGLEIQYVPAGCFVETLAEYVDGMIVNVLTPFRGGDAVDVKSPDDITVTLVRVTYGRRHDLKPGTGSFGSTSPKFVFAVNPGNRDVSDVIRELFDLARRLIINDVATHDPRPVIQQIANDNPVIWPEWLVTQPDAPTF